jgi:Tfp pilus assembly protein PilP
MDNELARPGDHNQGSCAVSRIRVLSTLVCLCLGLGACGVETPVGTEVTPLKRRQEAKPPTLDMFIPKADEEPYTYDASARRDPFKPLLAPSKPPPLVVEDHLNCPPLQDFELASLKLIAIVWGDLGRKAMLKAPNGRGYSVTEQMLVGRNCGRVQRIDSNAVVIEETRRDAEGKVLKEEVVLRLREQEG